MPRRNASRSPEGSSGRSKSTNRGSLTAVAWRSNDRTFIGPGPDRSVLKRFDPGVRATAQTIHQLKCRGRRPNDSSSGVFGIDGDLNHVLIHQFRDRFIDGGGRGDIGAKHEALHIQGGCAAAILNDNPIQEPSKFRPPPPMQKTIMLAGLKAFGAPPREEKDWPAASGDNRCTTKRSPSGR